MLSTGKGIQLQLEIGENNHVQKLSVSFRRTAFFLNTKFSNESINFMIVHCSAIKGLRAIYHRFVIHVIMISIAKILHPPMNA